MHSLCELQKSVTTTKYRGHIGNDELMCRVKIKFSVLVKGQYNLRGFYMKVSAPLSACLGSLVCDSHKYLKGVWQPYIQNRNIALYFSTFTGNLEQSAPCDSGLVLSRFSFGQSFKRGQCTVLLLKLQTFSHCPFRRTNTHTPWDEAWE